MPRKYGGFVITASNVRAVRHVVISAFINSVVILFNSALRAHSVSISGDMSRPVSLIPGLFAAMHSPTPPVPTPTSSNVFILRGAYDASHTASDVGLYAPRYMRMRPPIRVKIACFSAICI